MAQKSMMFVGQTSQSVDAGCSLKIKMDEEINEFLADGKKVIHMGCSLATQRNELVYIVTLIYENPAPETVELGRPLDRELRDEAEADPGELDRLMASFGTRRLPAFRPIFRPTREPAIAASADKQAEPNANGRIHFTLHPPRAISPCDNCDVGSFSCKGCAYFPDSNRRN